MLQLTLEDGRIVQRVFAGFVKTQEELEAFIAEMQEEVKDNGTERPLLCEIWKDITPKKKGGSIRGHGRNLYRLRKVQNA